MEARPLGLKGCLREQELMGVSQLSLANAKMLGHLSLSAAARHPPPCLAQAALLHLPGVATSGARTPV